MSSAQDAPFPSSGKFVEAVRLSCQALRTSAHIAVEADNIKRLLISPAFTSSYHRVSASHGVALPLNFPSALAELNLLAILSLLNFASGYRVPLHEHTGRGAWDSIRALVFALFITSSIGGEGDYLSARGMHAIDAQKIAELMGVSLHTERPHDTIPGVVVGQLGGPMHELVMLIVGTLNETGKVLVEGGYPDLGSFVVEALKEGEKAKAAGGPGAQFDVVLERIVRAIPAFRDMATVGGQPVYCFKKALFLIHAIELRFGALSPPPFPVPSTSDAPVFTDNVLPSMLVHLGVLDLSSASHDLSSLFPRAGTPEQLIPLLAEASPQELDRRDTKKIPPVAGPVLTQDQAYILRAAAIDACELIVDVARTMDVDDKNVKWINEITLPKLDMWIWAVAKDRTDYRRLERFVLTNTVFF